MLSSNKPTRRRAGRDSPLYMCSSGVAVELRTSVKGGKAGVETLGGSAGVGEV